MVSLMRPLKPHKKSYLPIVIGIDTEDNQAGAPDNFICMAAYCANLKKARFFTSREEARKFLLKKRNKKTIFFAHNLQYELSNLDFPEGSITPITSSHGIIGGRFGRSIFIDTSKFFQTSLKNVGKIFNVQKLDFDTSLLKNQTWTTLSNEIKQIVKKYCIRDAKITAIAGFYLVQMTQKLRTSFKSFTAASMSLRLFRLEALTEPINPRPMEINDIERLAYYGGRTEVFDYRKHNEVFYDDINSSYPFSMTQPLPRPDKYERVREKYEDIEDYFGITLAKIEAPKLHIPVLPYKLNGKLIFPTGKWIGVYTHAELNYAKQFGYKIKAIESIIYPEKFTAFENFIKSYYEKKQKSTTEAEKAFYKLVLNSLYGKFAEKRYEKLLCRIETLDKETFERYKDRLFEENGWVSLRGDRLSDPKHCFPVLSAYITSYSRIKLYEDRLKHSDKICYCDTDSVISPDPIDINLGNEIGQWKRCIYKSFQAFAPKFYLIDENKKIKGVPKSANELDIFHYTYFKPLKLSEALRRHMQPNQWIEVRKEINPKYDKRIKLPDGTTKPLNIAFDNTIHNFDEFNHKV